MGDGGGVGQGAPLVSGEMVTTVRVQGGDRTILGSGYSKKACSFLHSVLSGNSFLELLQRYEVFGELTTSF